MTNYVAALLKIDQPGMSYGSYPAIVGDKPVIGPEQQLPVSEHEIRVLGWQIQIGKSGISLSFEQRRNLVQFLRADAHFGFDALLNRVQVLLVGGTGRIPFE